VNSDPRQLRRAIAWLGAGVFGSAVLQYALFFAAARFLGVADYGAFSLALTVATLAAPLCDLGTSVSLVCVGAQRPLALLPQLGASLLLRAATCVPVGGAALAVGALAGYGDTFALLFVPLFVAALADGIGTLGASACQAQDRVATAALLQVGRNLLRGGALATSLWFGCGALGLAVQFALASVLGAVPAVWLATGGRLPRARWADVAPTLRFALPFGMAVLATLLHAQIAVAVLGVLAGDEEVGRFHASARFVLLLQMVPQVVAMATAPYSFRVALDGLQPSAQVYRVKLSVLAMLGLLATLLLVTAGAPLVHWCLGPKFAGAETLLIAMAPVVFVKFVAAALGDTLGAIARQDRLSLGCWLAMAVNVVVSLVLVPAHGAGGAVVAMLVSETFLLAWHATQLVQAGMDLAWRQVLRHALLVAAGAGAAAALLPATFVVPIACGCALLLLVCDPTAEERLLLKRLPRGAS
jgi:O-antigen/teichoic acid export membrane protein